MDKFILECLKCHARISLRVASVSMPDMQIRCENCWKGDEAPRLHILEIHSEDRGDTPPDQADAVNRFELIGREDVDLDLGIGATGEID